MELTFTGSLTPTEQKSTCSRSSASYSLDLHVDFAPSVISLTAGTQWVATTRTQEG